jgi:hypothetical protein
MAADVAHMAFFFLSLSYLIFMLELKKSNQPLKFVVL